MIYYLNIAVTPTAVLNLLDWNRPQLMVFIPHCGIPLLKNFPVEWMTILANLLVGIKMIPFNLNHHHFVM